jgi:hypothetical protein
VHQKHELNKRLQLQPLSLAPPAPLRESQTSEGWSKRLAVRNKAPEVLPRYASTSTLFNHEINDFDMARTLHFRSPVGSSFKKIRSVMHKITTPALLLIAILIGGVLTSATAQKRKPPISVDPPAPSSLSGNYKISVAADLLSNGEVEYRTPGLVGWSCSGTTDGDLPGYIFISMSASAPVMLPDGSEVRYVTSGTWSKLIFLKGLYTGSVNGRIVGGQIVSEGQILSTEPLRTTINLQLVGDGGTETYVGNAGSGTFDGVVDLSTKGGPKVFGNLNLNY